VKPADFKTRRATADDVPQLLLLWHNAGLAAAELEKCFTEFQIVEDVEGRIVGAIALRMHDKQGWIHSEAFGDFAMTDLLRPMLWRRLSNVCQSYALLRIWTTESAPYWKHQDFAAADEETMKRFPAEFGALDKRWLTLKLREEIDIDQYLEKEFMVFKKSEATRNSQILEQAKVFKTLATLIALATLVLTGIGLYYLIRHQGVGAQ
jgi:N-acetylglutamate synthase-like GNAT family acetyltransferase